VSNLGPDLAAATGIGFALNAESATFAVVAPGGWNCDAAQIAGGMTSIACHNDGLANGASATFAISATSTTAQIGSSVNLAVAATTLSFDPVSGNDEAVSTIAVNAAPAVDLALQFDGPATVPANTFSIAYTATLRNLGTLPAQQPVVAFSGNTMTTTASVTAPGWQCSKQGSSRVASFRCTRSNLAAGASANFAIKVNARPTPASRIVQIEGAATSASTDADASNNNASIGTAISF
jgi:hypothetical protein